MPNEDDYVMQKNKQYQSMDKRAEAGAANQRSRNLSSQSDAIPNEISIQINNFEI